MFLRQKKNDPGTMLEMQERMKNKENGNMWVNLN